MDIGSKIYVISRNTSYVLETNEILGFAIDQAAAINTYWNIYIAVATAIIGIMASGKAFTHSHTLKIFLSGAFVVFAYSNLNAIIRLGELRMALLNMLPDDLPNRVALMASLRPAKWWVYTGFHVFLDIVILAAIWFVPWPRADNST